MQSSQQVQRTESILLRPIIGIPLSLAPSSLKSARSRANSDRNRCPDRDFTQSFRERALGSVALEGNVCQATTPMDLFWTKQQKKKGLFNLGFVISSRLDPASKVRDERRSNYCLSRNGRFPAFFIAMERSTPPWPNTRASPMQL